MGLIEGLTEFLPISSTGHLILASYILKISQPDFIKSFEIIIQLGAILAVVVLYWKKFLLNWQVLKKIIIAFIPTAIIGLIFYKIVKQFLLGNNLVVVLALFIGGIFIIIFEFLYREKQGATEDIEKISNKQAIALGICQSIAIIPGVSRSAATIIGGLGMGLKRKTIVEFSFLLAVPTMLAATGLDLYKSANAFLVDQIWYLLIGFIVSFVVAVVSIKFLLSFIQKNNFIAFGIYRILIATIFAIFILNL